MLVVVQVAALKGGTMEPRHLLVVPRIFGCRFSNLAGRPRDRRRLKQLNGHAVYLRVLGNLVSLVVREAKDDRFFGHAAHLRVPGPYSLLVVQGAGDDLNPLKP